MASVQYRHTCSSGPATLKYLQMLRHWISHFLKPPEVLSHFWGYNHKVYDNLDKFCEFPEKWYKHHICKLHAYIPVWKVIFRAEGKKLREFLERKKTKTTHALKNLTLQTVIKRLWPTSKNALLEISKVMRSVMRSSLKVTQ